MRVLNPITVVTTSLKPNRQGGKAFVAAASWALSVILDENQVYAFSVSESKTGRV
jgi:hypothetical protein